ncbi:glycoside hydrolase family 32 protein [Hymenobacter sp. HDW8]|uniref:glycoside hydrolase family 32 protein n=1 Tax=Hymenobacter sp. HDW8 TaxID=2714932 RepID=UPI00140898C4|nr:glycoside hydrolase family 32 protein [Hymenobacter sp. HDW8]QIL75148.1 glycoside hydrolase family 32 protein [Hymenobacter sp. HDW8]
MKKLICLTVGLLGLTLSGWAQRPQATEQYRPKFHFTPKAKWMNDPNGMVYSKGTYHLFYQYYPDSTIWGPMHWGHATSKDLVSWQHQPVALYPDSLGYIFSGSAVLDVNNTSGFGKNGQAPMVAIFTHHNPKLEKLGGNKHQNQSIAYSLDEGKTWTKYEKNPVLKNPGIPDFRDPKVSWYEKDKKWIMTLATKDRITFYSSPNLKDWTKQSEFGEKVGAHGGVWECPDLFQLTLGGKKQWVLLVSINPGGPNKGSATQYFVGDFDGKTFTPLSTDTKWVDYGPDNYAGVTWSNTGDRKIFLGWMSNWEYANQVPTYPWRSAMTIPRDLSLRKVGTEVLLVSQPSKEVSKLESGEITLDNVAVKGEMNLSDKTKNTGPFQLKLSADQLADFAVVLTNDRKEEVLIGYDKKANQYYIDRTKSGKLDFSDKFASRATAPRLTTSAKMDLTLIVDAASVELFADEGLTAMTGIFFPNEEYKIIKVRVANPLTLRKVTYKRMGVGI